MTNSGRDFSTAFEQVLGQITDSIKLQMESRSYRAANELRNASQLVLRGQRSGRQYTVPGTGRMRYNKRKKTASITYKKYTASAPGEPPAVRTGVFRMSWQPTAKVVFGSYISRIESNARTDNGLDLSGILEHGTSRMAPRPYQDRILDKAEKPIVRIYEEPYI